MANNNENSIIRPATLMVPGPSTSPNNQSQSNRNDLDPRIENLVLQALRKVVRSEIEDIIKAALQPTSELNDTVDQSINPEHRNNLQDLDKIPEVVRILRDFSGQPGEFSSWKKNVDRILQIYDSIKGAPKYFGILTAIRNKITGSADIALESYNTPLEGNFQMPDSALRRFNEPFHSRVSNVCHDTRRQAC